MLETAFIGIGSNIGNPVRQCQQAIETIRRGSDISEVRVSPLYRTEPYGFLDQPWFINGVIQVTTHRSPLGLLDFLQGIEFQHRRQRGFRWGPRTLDLDILLWENRILVSQHLRIPHRQLHLRRFVLQPLMDLAPQWVHPQLDRTVADLFRQLSDPSDVKRLESTERISENET